MHIFGDREEIQTDADGDKNMSQSQIDEYETVLHDKPSSIDPFALISEVKKHQVLFNKFSNLSLKMQAWDAIYTALFPSYPELDVVLRDVIKKNVRKRWKALRDSVVKDHRRRIEKPNSKRRQMTPTVKEMQFLIPYLKHARVPSASNDEEPSTEFYKSVNNDETHSPELCKSLNDDTIDLTFQDDTDDSQGEGDDDDDLLIKNEAFYPSVHLRTSEDSDEYEWQEDVGATTAEEYNYPEPNYEACEVQVSEPKRPEQDDETIVNILKRRRTDSENELSSKLSEIVDRCNEESQDEDRMFLLSLLSDFKRIPPQKKLKVKSTLVTALYEALD